MTDQRDFKIDASGQSRVNAIGRDLNAKEVNFGDRYYNSDGPREIRVTGVGEHPPNYADYWVDRTAYQAQLRDRLMQTSVTQILAEGGFGKSSLAAWVFDHYQDQTLKLSFEKRVWVSLGRSQSFDRFARYVLQELGRPVTDPQANEESLLRELVLQLNDPNGAVRMLVVLDQVEAAIERLEWDWYEAFLQEWTQKGRRSAVLVTSRSAVPAGATIALAGMTEDEGSAFLMREGLTGDRFSDLILLAKGHPLLLKLAASWTKETYDARVDDRAIDFFTKLFSHYDGDPRAVVSAIFDVIFKALPLALQELLCRLSVYRLPIDLAMAQAMDETATDEDLELLAGQGVLLLQGTRFVLHPLVAGLVRARVTEEVRRDGHERAIGFYEANYQAWDGTIESCREELENFYHACELGQYQRAKQFLGRCFGLFDHAGEWQALLPLYEKLTHKWSTMGEVEENLGEAWYLLGSIYQDLRNYQSAINAYLNIKAIVERLDLKAGIGASLHGLGSAYHSLGDFQKAIDFHSQSLEIAKAVGDRNNEGGSLCNLGSVHLSLGNYTEAIQLFQQALPIQCEVKNRKFEANCLGNLGNAYFSLGDYQKAIIFHAQALEIRQMISHKPGIASSLGNLGNVYFTLGDYQKAIILCNHQYEILHEIGDMEGENDSLRNHANSLWALSNVYQQRGRPKLSMHYRHQAYRIWQDMNLPLAAAPFPAFFKNLAASMGDTWAEQMIVSEKSMAWLNFSIGYLLFALRTLLSPLIYLQKKLKIKPLWFWVGVGIAVFLVIAGLKR